MRKDLGFLPFLIWWFLFAGLWGMYRLYEAPSDFSEIIAKPIIWLGITAVCFYVKLIPKQVLNDLRKKYLRIRPLLTIWVYPFLFILTYFFIINFFKLEWPNLDLPVLGLAIMTNFATGIVEEITYRGVLYVWLLQKYQEMTAFIIVQILFLVGHVPVLLFHSQSTESALSHAFFIVLMGAISTAIFRINRSLYSSIVAHGTWNTLVYYFLLR